MNKNFDNALIQAIEPVTINTRALTIHPTLTNTTTQTLNPHSPQLTLHKILLYTDTQTFAISHSQQSTHIAMGQSNTKYRPKITIVLLFLIAILLPLDCQTFTLEKMLWLHGNHSSSPILD